MAKKTTRPEMKPAYCPACKFHQVDCNTDPEDWTLPCECYEQREEGEGKAEPPPKIVTDAANCVTENAAILQEPPRN